MSKSSPPVDARTGQDAPRDGLELLRPTRLVLDTEGHVGAALRKARESLDLDIDDVAQATRVKADYLAAIEQLDLSPLPARPFAVGYVRAYARALGLDPDLVAARFRHETPSVDTSLRAPLGVEFRRRLRIGRLAVAFAVLVTALAGWNLMVRVGAPPPRAKATALPTPAAPPAVGPARLGAPLPAPPEATTPPPYETPGLAKAAASIAPDAAAAAAASIAEEAASAPVVGAVAPGAAFSPHGAIYGPAGPNTGVILQAMRPMSLVVRGGGGAVLFARQLAAGEAWRAPDAPGLVADVDVRAAAEVYVQGRAVGPLTGNQTPLSALTASKPSAP